MAGLNSTFAAVIVALLTATSSAGVPASVELDQFVGTTPCGTQVQRFIGIRADAPCDRVTWRLTVSSHHSTYTLVATFGKQESNGPGFVNGGDTARLNGSWIMVKGTSTDPNAFVYRLTDASSRRGAFLAKVGDDLLHVLNDDRSLAVGDASFSYTLSRTGVRYPDIPTQTAGNAPVTSGVFEGRTPCRALAQQLGASTPGDCFKLKWRLTLLEEPSSRVPTTYKLEGTLYRSRPLVGSWSMEKNAGRIIYRLDLGRSASLTFVNADDNVLFLLDSNGAYRVGDDAFSYTLNRTN